MRAIDEDDADYIKALRRIAIGEEQERITTAIDLIVVAQRVFEDLKDEGVFEWDFEDES